MDDIQSFEQLEEYLRNWRSFEDASIYDHVGMVHLFKACTENLRQFGLREELATMSEILGEENVRFLSDVVAPSDS